MASHTSTTDIAHAITDVKVTRWRGGQHPSLQTIARMMEQEGLRPYAFTLGPNYRDGVKSHGYGKVMYCVEGTIEINLPDLNQRVLLRSGDRLELPRGIRHSATVGANGAKVLESNVRQSAIRETLQ